MQGSTTKLGLAAITLFAGHTSHVLGPDVLLNASLPHAVQFPGTPENATSQMHSALPACDTLFGAQDTQVEKFDAATLAEKVFAGHALHGKSPGNVLYVPVGHSWQNSGRTLTSTSVPCGLTSYMAIWLAPTFRTKRYRPVSDDEHRVVIQSVLVRFKDTMAQITLLVLEFTSPTCMYRESTEMTLTKSLTDTTVTRRSKSTRHHWLLPNVVAEKLDTLLSLAAAAAFTTSNTPTAISAFSVLDCVAAHALLRSGPQDLAKLSCAVTTSYIGPRYPALHVQLKMLVAPVRAALVGTHAVHTVMPSRSAYVFTGHSVQADEFAPDLYLPIAHPLQNGPYAPVKPALQKHCVKLVAAGSEYVFAGHDSHSQFPVMFLYIPGAHFVHRTAEAPVYPGMHPQSWIRLLPGGATEYGGHDWQTGLPSGEYSVSLQLAHVSLLVAAKLSEYVPTVQFEHASCASRGLNVPGTHASQSSPS